MGLNPITYQSILKAYDLAHENLSIKELSQGLINDTYVLLDNQQPQFLLQRINGTVFKHADAILFNQIKALTVLNNANKSYPQLLKTVDDESFVLDPENDYWRISEFVPESKAYDCSTDSKMANEAGKLLAEFHNTLQEETPQDYKIHLPNFNDLNFRFEEFDDAYKKASKERVLNAKELLGFIDLLKPLLVNNSLTLPQRICHNDTKLNNMLFSNSKALCLIDLDTLMPGYLFYDFGDLFRTAAFSAKEGENNLELIKLNKEYTKTLIEGFVTTMTDFKDDELKSLSLGTVYMPFIHGLRALTDYFSNDKYYKVNYPTENLDRAKSLFRFAKEAHKNNAFIDKCIKESSASVLT